MTTRTPALTLAFLIAATVQAQGAPHRPAAVPADFQVTPFGYFHPSCVVRLAKGDELRLDHGIIMHATGLPTAMHACAYPHYRADGERVIGDDRGRKNPDPTASGGWILSAYVTTRVPTNSYAYLGAEWTVPPAPTSTSDGQVLYYFPALEDIDDMLTIMQPVLDWNASWQNAWGIASWNCCQQGTTYESTPMQASPGDTIGGYISSTCPAGTKACGAWDILIEDLRNGNSSELVDTSNFGQTMNLAYAGVLEEYGGYGCNDFPPGGGISFGNLVLLRDNLVPVAHPQWILTPPGPGCNYDIETPRQVILEYSNE